jgi:transcriptional regulator
MSEKEPIIHVGRRFRIADRTQMLARLVAYDLGTLISIGAAGWPRASASPLVIRPDDRGQPRLYAHLDRRKPQPALARAPIAALVAQGHRAYVSPGWFPRRPSAPTYLHVTVHVRGHAPTA